MAASRVRSSRRRGHDVEDAAPLEDHRGRGGDGGGGDTRRSEAPPVGGPLNAFARNEMAAHYLAISEAALKAFDLITMPLDAPAVAEYFRCHDQIVEHVNSAIADLRAAVGR